MTGRSSVSPSHRAPRPGLAVSGRCAQYGDHHEHAYSLRSPDGQGRPDRTGGPSGSSGSSRPARRCRRPRRRSCRQGHDGGNRSRGLSAGRPGADAELDRGASVTLRGRQGTIIIDDPLARSCPCTAGCALCAGVRYVGGDYTPVELRAAMHADEARRVACVSGNADFLHDEGRRFSVVQPKGNRKARRAERARLRASPGARTPS